MTITIIGIVITALAIYLDKATLYKNRVFPPVAFAGVLTVIGSLVL
jgi:hypothetical protein